MKPQELFCVGIRLLGVYYLANGLFALIGLFPLLQINNPTPVWTGCAVVGLQIAIGIYLLTGARLLVWWSGYGE